MILLIGTVLLIRNMNKQIGKLPETFEPDRPEPDQAADEGTDPGAARPARHKTRKSAKRAAGVLLLPDSGPVASPGVANRLLRRGLQGCQDLRGATRPDS